MSYLKDKALPFRERLAQAKRLWTSKEFFPKKEQTLLDWIVNALNSKDE